MDSFQSPAALCRGTDFWMLNDELNENELRRQMRAMHAQGVASLIARTYVGLRSDYPGPDWMRKMHVIVDEARALGMTIFLQAGYMPEAVLDLPEEYSLGDLHCRPAGQEGEGITLLSRGGLDYCVKPSKIVLDMLSPEASAFYVRQSYENMWREFRQDFGKTILSVWVDEPSYARVALPWTARLPEAYEALWGEPFPMEKIYLLFEDGEGDGLLRLRYWRTVLHLMKHSYFRAIQDWGKKNGVWISGHLMEEDSMERQIRATCFTMPMYQYFDIPGVDYLTTYMDWRYGRIKPENPMDPQRPLYAPCNTPLQCASAAHQRGQRLVLAEMYGVTTENLNFRDQKYIFDRFASMGVNHRSVHGLFYSLRGRGKRAYPPHVNDYQPYWPQYHLLTDAVARESHFLRQGAPLRDVVVLHPIETAFSLYHGRDAAGNQAHPRLQRADTDFNQLLRGLLAQQVNFELGDEDALSEIGAAEENGALRIGEMTYQTVVLPAMEYIRESTRALLLQVIARGGRVLCWQHAPKWTDAGAPCALPGARVASSLPALLAALAQAPAAFRFLPQGDCTGVQILCRGQGEERFVFLFNDRCDREAQGTLTLPGEYACQRWQEMDGSVSPYPCAHRRGETEISLCLPEGGALLLHLEKGPALPPVAPSPQASLALTGPWRLRRLDPNALVLEMFRFTRGEEPLGEKTYPILAIQDKLLKEGYRGPVCLETAFRLNRPLTGLKLAVERPRQQAFFLDGAPLAGKPAGYYRAFGFETIALPPLEAGEHHLRVARDFAPQRRAVNPVTSLFENLGGVELEPMLLTGDFGVYSALEPPLATGCVRLNEDFTLDAEPEAVGDELVSAGYPFYCGRMELSQEITLPQGAKNPRLALDGLNAAAAEVLVNGQPCGALCWLPYEAPLTGLRPGKNTVTLRLYGTMRNLLGPWHRTVGEIGACWAGYGAPNQPWQGNFANENRQYYPDWAEDRKPDRLGWTESYLLLPLGVAHPRIWWE